MLTVLNVAFPSALPDTGPRGVAEQLLARLDRDLVDAGARSIVVAASGSRFAGRLVAVPRCDPGDPHARVREQRAIRRAVDGVLARERIDVIHLHGGDFDEYLPPRGPPALVSLHLPLETYTAAALRTQRPLTWLQPVSASQSRAAPREVRLLPPIENGIDCALFAPVPKRGFALALGNACAEKGLHDAIDACKLARVTLIAAGAVLPEPAHRRYFAAEVRPRLDRTRRWIGAIAAKRKRRLLGAARCVLLPSRAVETSSLVAMEALAAGTPVIAYPAGALADIIEHGITGYLVDGIASMARAIHCVERIDPQRCRQRAHERFALDHTAAAYLALYRRLGQLGNTARRDAAVEAPFAGALLAGA